MVFQKAKQKNNFRRKFMEKRFWKVIVFLLMLMLCGCSQSSINDLPFLIILLPTILAVFVVVAVIVIIFKTQPDFLISKKRIIKKNLAREISRAKRFNQKTGLLILDVKNAVPRGVHYFLPGRTVDVEFLQSKLREHDHIIKMSLRRYKVILSQIASEDSPEIIKDRLLKIAEEKKWGNVRIGVSSYPRDGETPDDLIKAAEKDMEEI